MGIRISFFSGARFIFPIEERQDFVKIHTSLKHHITEKRLAILRYDQRHLTIRRYKSDF